MYITADLTQVCYWLKFSYGLYLATLSEVVALLCCTKAILQLFYITKQSFYAMGDPK